MVKKIKDTTSNKIDTLKPAVVLATLRPRFRGDTLEFNTENMVIQPNAVVEEMLKRLPGLHIDPDGSISYNGEKIEHLLVDGEDIFGSNPTMITRNFDASKIAKIQILNRRTDAANFSGVDDGGRIKTLNLVMRENAKNGYFGKAELGGGTDSYYNMSGMLAAFRGKEQITALIQSSNVGLTGALVGNSDALGASAGVGIPQINSAAMHYGNSWSGINHLVVNYQNVYYNSQPQAMSQIYQIQPDSVYRQIQQSKSQNSQQQGWIAATYDYLINRKSALRLVINGSINQGRNRYSAYQISAFNDTVVNNNQKTIADNLDNRSFQNDISWRMQIGKRPTSILSVSVLFRITDNLTKGNLYSVANLFNGNGIIQGIDTTNEYKEIADHASQYEGGLNYTKLFFKWLQMDLSYGLSVVNDQPSQLTFNLQNGKNDDLVDSLSNNYKTQTTYRRSTLGLGGKIGHLNYSIANDWVSFSYMQRDILADSIVYRDYFNWRPRFLLEYFINHEANLNLGYSTSTQEPNVTQLTPLVNNNDPLHIEVGNPALKPAFTQALKLDFHHLGTWSLNVGVGLGLVSNSISIKTTTDSFGRQISQPVNVNGGQTSRINILISGRVLGFDAGVRTSASFSSAMNFVNEYLAKNETYNVGAGITLNKYIDSKINFEMASNLGYFRQVSSINTEVANQYWRQSDQAALTIYLIKDFTINTNVNYSWQGKANSFSPQISTVLWNSYIDRNLLHNKLTVKVQLNNVLGENMGIVRSSVNNVNTQSSNNMLGRYWMLSAIYHFDKKFKKNN